MNEEIKSLYLALDEEVVQLCARWKLHKQLFRSQESVDLLNKSGSYVFFQLQKLIIDYIFLTFSKLTDPAKLGKYENTSIDNLLEKLKGTVGCDSLKEYHKNLKELKQICESMRCHRNKRVAHSDINNASKADIDWLPSVTYDQIEDALEILCKMMKDIMLVLFNLDRNDDTIFSYGTDGSFLLYTLRKAHASTSSTEDV